MNTIDDMQYEMDFYDYYNEFEYNHDLVVIIVIIVIIRMNFTQFQFFKRQIRIWNVYSFQYSIIIKLFPILET